MLEANDINCNDHIDNVFIVFKDKTCCKHVLLHLKMIQLDKLKGNMVDIEKILRELDFKYTSLLRQNEWTSSKVASSINSKYIAMTIEPKVDQNLLL